VRSDAQIMVDANQQAAQRVARSDVHIVTDANWWATHRATHNNAQIAADANRRVVHRAAHSDAQIALENAVHLMLEHFYILINNKKRVTRIVKLTRASVNSCQKSVAKKFKTLIVKHIVPNVN
jgi:hypothetical protein